MAESLSLGNKGLALLANSIATGAILFVIITIFMPISGAHFNPVVTLVMWLRGKIAFQQTFLFIFSQIIGGILGVWIVHFIFELEVLQLSNNIRTGMHQYFSEALATFGLLLVIIMGDNYNPHKLPALVGLYICSAYWFTSSTSFANPAVTIARTLSDTFSGINYADTIPFIVFQIIGGFFALGVANYLMQEKKT